MTVDSSLHRRGECKIIHCLGGGLAGPHPLHEADQEKKAGKAAANFGHRILPYVN